MRHLGIVFVAVLCLVFGASAGATTPEHSRLLESSRQFDRALSAHNAPSDQRALVAVSMAAAELQTTDPVELRDAYDRVSGTVVELLLSDTSSSWVNDAWSAESRTTYTYDGSNRLSTMTAQSDPGTGWVNSYQGVMTYDASSRLQTTTYKQWSGSAWVNYSLTTYSSFTAEGFPQLALTQFWNGSAWRDTMRTQYTYSSGHMTTSTTQDWKGGAWVNQSKWTMAYDGSWNMTEWLIQTWGGSAWVNSSRTNSIYNGSGDELRDIDQMWNNGAWENISKDTFTYDASHREILDVRSQWFMTFWMDMYADTMKYSGNLLIEKVTAGLLDGSLEREQYSYTAGGNETLMLSQMWDMYGEAWVNVSKDVSVYSGGTPSCCVGTRGNINGSGVIDLSDLSYLITYLTVVPHLTLPCTEAANIDGAGVIDLTDLSYLIAYLTVVPRPTLPSCP